MSGSAQPLIVANPATQTVCSGDNADFVAAANGVPAPTVQWQRSVDGGATFGDIAGATLTTYAMPATVADSGSQYRAVFSNAAGSATTTAATLTVSAADATIAAPNAVTATSTANNASAPSGMASYGWSIANGAITSATNGPSVVFTAGPSGSTRLTLVTMNAGGCSAMSSRDVTITPQPTITVDSVSVSEPLRGTSTTMTFTLSLSNASSQSVSVMYNTSNGTAIAGVDYAASCDVVTFQPGSTTRKVAVTVYGSGIKYAKTLWLNLSNPTNATIATVAGYPIRGKGTINP